MRVDAQLVINIMYAWSRECGKQQEGALRRHTVVRPWWREADKYTGH